MKVLSLFDGISCDQVTYPLHLLWVEDLRTKTLEMITTKIYQ